MSGDEQGLDRACPRCGKPLVVVLRGSTPVVYACKWCAYIEHVEREPDTPGSRP